VHDLRVEHASGVGIWLPECFEDFTVEHSRRVPGSGCASAPERSASSTSPVAEIPDRPIRERILQSPFACGDDRKTGRYLRACEQISLIQGRMPASAYGCQSNNSGSATTECIFFARTSSELVRMGLHPDGSANWLLSDDEESPFGGSRKRKRSTGLSNETEFPKGSCQMLAHPGAGRARLCVKSGMPSARSPPPFFGIMTRRTGSGRYVFATNSSRKPASHASRPCSSFSASRSARRHARVPGGSRRVHGQRRLHQPRQTARWRSSTTS